MRHKVGHPPRHKVPPPRHKVGTRFWAAGFGKKAFREQPCIYSGALESILNLAIYFRCDLFPGAYTFRGFTFRADDEEDGPDGEHGEVRDTKK